MLLSNQDKEARDATKKLERQRELHRKHNARYHARIRSNRLLKEFEDTLRELHEASTRKAEIEEQLMPVMKALYKNRVLPALPDFARAEARQKRMKFFSLKPSFQIVELITPPAPKKRLSF